MSWETFTTDCYQTYRACENKKDWEPFKFDSNKICVVCENKDDWKKVKEKFIEHGEKKGIVYLKSAKINMFLDASDVLMKKKMLNFGTRIEHSGDYTLSMFFKDNNMEL